MARKVKRAPKRKAPQRKVKAVVEGKRFAQRVKKPQQQGKDTKSQLIRVDSGFADYCREKAATEGTITEVTRKLVTRLRQAELEAFNKVVL